MVDLARQFPSPSAGAWLFDLTAYRGPQFVVLCQDAQEAVGCLAQHLLELGMASDAHDVAAMLDDAPVERVRILR